VLGRAARELTEQLREAPSWSTRFNLLEDRVLRFERVTSYLRTHPHTRLAELSAAAGYADQSHLTREFQTIAGCSPRQWMIEELPALPADFARNPQGSAIVSASSARSH
jgi:AraC-like DNA-binding protein